MTDFPQYLLDEIRGRIPISEIVGRTVSFDKTKSQPQRGDWWGLCPFHAEKSPSFHCEDRKGVYHCFGCGVSGDLFKFVQEYERRSFPEAVRLMAETAGVVLPDAEAHATETLAERAQREAEIAERERLNDEKRQRDQADQNAFRAKEIAKARGKWALASGSLVPVRTYLAGRLGGFALPALPFARAIVDEAYWHGNDEGGRPVAIHSGPAMVLPFVDAEGSVVGCHLTWLDARGPKGRPALADPATGERLATKKMRGRKKGGLIPLVGFIEIDGKILPDPARTRFVCGEGIENVLAVAVAEAGSPPATVQRTGETSGSPSEASELKGGADITARADTIYAAAGDLGNLAGRAEGTFPHPTLKSRGGKAPLRVAGPEPKAGEPADAAAQVPDHVTDVLLVADGDSEIVATGAAMMRAEARFGAEGRTVATAWPPRGQDFADLLAATERAA